MPIGYHFTADVLRDGTPIPAIGEKLVFDGEIEICRAGLHWSEHPFDALRYVPGHLLHKVKCSDPVQSDYDKHVSRERTILATINTEYICRRFAADQALGVSHMWDMPDVMREYLTTMDEDLRAAADAAAWSAADAADAADAAWSSAWSSAWSATWSAADAAAWSAADAADAAAWYAADTAWSSAWSAAWSAADAAARSEFKLRVDAAFENKE